MYKMDDDDAWPKVVRDMERREARDEGIWGFFVALVAVSFVCVVALVVSGCAVSLSFQPAKWNAPSAVESGAKQVGRE